MRATDARREEEMAARNILNLDISIAPRLVRILYGLTLILIALGVVAGLMQGARTATRMPPMPPLTAQTNPGSPQAQMPPAPTQGLRGPRLSGRFGGPGMGPRRFGLVRGPLGINMRRDPALFGAFMIVRTLVAGFIGLLVVRILAEMALSVLAMKPRDNAAS
jgi:hypothetical protein